MTDPKLAPFSLHATSYKTVQGVEFPAHILIPKSIAASTTPEKYPVLVRFHGGYLVTGSALYTEWLPDWAIDLVVKSEAILVMPDYRLLPEASGQEILEDVKDFWTWVASDVNGLSSYLSRLNSSISVDFGKVAVYGESAGGYLAIRSSLFPEDSWGNNKGFTGPKAVIAAYPMTLLKKDWYSVASETKSPFGVPQLDEGLLNDHIADIGKGGEKIVISADPPARLEIAVTMVQKGRWTEIFKRDGGEGLWLDEIIEDLDVREEKRPYLLTFHGTKDTAVPWEDTEEWVEIYGKKFGEDRVKGVWREGMEHGFDTSMDEEKGEGEWLHAQSNWNVEMSQPLKLSIRSQNSEPKLASGTMAELYRKAPAQEILLPMEIISQILSYIPNRLDTQYTFYSCALVSRIWYSASIAILYERPYLSGTNFNNFVATVCPSKNAHIRQSALAPLVRRLDMGGLVHNSSRSLTARLLGRLKGNLVEFVAPQASFAINSFPALSKCTQLRYLDLSLISASISTRLLFQTLKTLLELETLLFPRTSNSDQDRIDEVYEWPPKLQGLHLAGGVDDHFLRTHLRHVPSTLSRFSIQHCSMVYAPALLETLEHLGPQLQHLTIRHPMNRMGVGALDYVLLACSSLTAFRISADFITDALFENITPGHPLRILDLDCSGTAGTEVNITAGAVYDAVEEGRLPFLRSVRVSSRLAWNATQSGRQDIIDLIETMEDLENETPLGIEPIGVWFSTD